MNILMVNKFLWPKGGAETYLIRLGENLKTMGHRVDYFGMDSPERTVGNRVDAYTGYMDFHSGSPWEKLGYSLRVIYSGDARRKIRRVLEAFQPDVCHLNNFNYQLTPSILLEIRKWERETGHSCKILYTAHDYQLVCPNHLCYDPGREAPCEKCLGGNYLHCIRCRCIHGSRLRSVLGAAEGFFWRAMGTYRQIDTVICCSRFLKDRLDRNPALAGKTVVLHNFAETVPDMPQKKGDYILYFGRYEPEKGVADLLQAAKELPDIFFRFAGSGSLKGAMEEISNVQDLGYLSGEDLRKLIRQARLTVCPSRWYENCPMSVLESLSLGTPVLGAGIGGIPELILPGVTGDLFESGNVAALTEKLSALWNDRGLIETMAENCRKTFFDTPRTYAERFLVLAGEEEAHEDNPD